MVLGTSTNTGAAGANVWGLDLLQECLPGANSPFKTMPRKASFRVAIRRTTRVGQRSGVPVEDLGIKPDEVHRITRNDVLKNDIDLIQRATKILAKLPRYSLSAKVQRVNNVPTRVVAKTNNITRLDAVLNARPLSSYGVKAGTTSFDLPRLSSQTNLLELRGFREGKLKVSIRSAL